MRPTATIAKKAGISNGSLFTYFETKADLLNHLYVELKAEMAAAAMDGLPTESDIRKQMLHTWTHMLRWATSCPEKRRTLAHLIVSDDITPASHKAGSKAMAGIAKLLERSRENGAPLEFTITESLTLTSFEPFTTLPSSSLSIIASFFVLYFPVTL